MLVERRRFIGYGLAGSGMAVMAPAICCDNENRVSSIDDIEKNIRRPCFTNSPPGVQDVSYAPIIVR